MAVMKRLATLIQVSDMHFGRPNPISADVQDWWCRFPGLSGYFGHCGRALRYLEEEVSMIRQKETDAFLLVSGDLTAYASDEQFALALSYLEDRAGFSQGRSLGLRFGPEKTFKIPGNHDHWSGKPAQHAFDFVMYGGPTNFFREIFSSMPRLLLQHDIGAGRQLVIVGIDTDAGLGRSSPSKFFARGSFVNQLRQAEDFFDGDPASQIRVLMMHHSRMDKRFICGINDHCRDALNEFLVRHRISVLLTGHVHVCDFEPETLVDGQTKWLLLESRCGTTSQRSLAPVGCKNAKLQPNSFLVHRIYEETSGAVIWKVEELVRGPWTPFKPASRRPVSISIDVLAR